MRWGHRSTRAWVASRSEGQAADVPCAHLVNLPGPDSDLVAPQSITVIIKIKSLSREPSRVDLNRLT
eukprot:800039-Prymnesium_polylepis.1